MYCCNAMKCNVLLQCDLLQCIAMYCCDAMECNVDEKKCKCLLVTALQLTFPDCIFLSGAHTLTLSNWLSKLKLELEFTFPFSKRFFQKVGILLAGEKEKKPIWACISSSPGRNLLSNGHKSKDTKDFFWESVSWERDRCKILVDSETLLN